MVGEPSLSFSFTPADWSFYTASMIAIVLESPEARQSVFSLSVESYHEVAHLIPEEAAFQRRGLRNKVAKHSFAEGRVKWVCKPLATAMGPDLSTSQETHAADQTSISSLAPSFSLRLAVLAA